MGLTSMSRLSCSLEPEGLTREEIATIKESWQERAISRKTAKSAELDQQT